MRCKVAARREQQQVARRDHEAEEQHGLARGEAVCRGGGGRTRAAREWRRGGEGGCGSEVTVAAVAGRR